MDSSEAALLLGGMGLRLEDADLARLLARTEGWPVGLVLAALAVREAPDPHHAVADLSGEERHIADYFAEEVLPHATRRTLTLLLRTSVLDVLTPSACSAVTGSVVTLEDLRALERASGFVLPIDGRAERFRLHHLLADMLRQELRRRDPAAWPALHRRAAAWAEAQDDPLAAVRHLRAAGDEDAAAQLVWHLTPALLTRGRLDTLRRMLACAPPAEVGERAPLALAMAWACTERDGHLVEHWTRRAEAASMSPLPGPPTALEAAVTLLRAVAGAGGVGAIAVDARRSHALDDPASPWQPVCHLLMGVASHLAGDATGGRRLLREASDGAGAAMPSIFVLAQSWLAAMAELQGDALLCRLHAGRAQEAMALHGLEGYASSALLHAVRSLEAARRDDPDRARVAAESARRLSGADADVMPWLAVMTRLVLARSAVRTGDEETARALAREAAELRGRIPDSPVLTAGTEALIGIVEGLGTPERGATALTAAELRVLEFLPTHLTFREIGERLHLSRFTIKSQALAAYRKLGATSRSEAVTRARRLGLLDEDPLLRAAAS